MLLRPDFSFKIPSLHDGIELDCRIYFPKHGSNADEAYGSGFAIFAHPYAPLGGCYDDPTVQSICSILVKTDFVTCTFNFRGAMDSQGSTSWTGKPELTDYVSVYSFMVHLMDSPDVMKNITLRRERPLLVLGGYSYGSMMASHLPEFEIIQSMHDQVSEGTSDYEIKKRAQEVANVFASFCEMELHSQRGSLHSDHLPGSPDPRREVMVGGHESENEGYRHRRNSSRRSIDVDKIRHGLDKVKRKLSLKTSNDDLVQYDADNSIGSTESVSRSPAPTIAYLLISPILQLVAGLTTAFSHLNFERKVGANTWKASKKIIQSLSENHTLAVYGDKDMFTSSRHMKKWTQELQIIPNSRFVSEEITGAGHFWHEPGACDALRTVVQTWITGLVGKDGQ